MVLFFNDKYGFQMSTGSLRREAKHQWKTRGMSAQIHQLHACQLLLIQMFYALVEHFCTQKKIKKKLLTGMFLQNFPQYFRVLRFLFSVHLNCKENCFVALACYDGMFMLFFIL